MGERLYFAYGSNINLDQMAHRCPNAQVVGPVVLENYKAPILCHSSMPMRCFWRARF